MIMSPKSISGSPTGSPVRIAEMLKFSKRHNILPQTEHFPMARVNDAIQHLLDGRARHSTVLDM